MTTTTWSKPTRLFRPLCVNDLQVEAIPNTVQLDNCNTCVTPMISGAEGGCAPDRTIARTVKVHLPFSLQEKNPSGVTTDHRTWGSRIISVSDGGTFQTEFALTQTWHTDPVPGGTTFSLVIPPYSLPCRRYKPMLTAWFQAFRPTVYSAVDTNTATWVRPVPPPGGFIDKCVWIPKPPPLLTSQVAEGYVSMTNSANSEYMWSVLPRDVSPFNTRLIPGTDPAAPPYIWPSHPNPPNPRLGHPDFQAVYDQIGLDPSINYGARPQTNLGVKGWIWTMHVTQVSYASRYAVYEVGLWALGYYTGVQTAGSTIQASHSTATGLFPVRNSTYEWHFSGNQIGTGLNGQTFYTSFPASVMSRPEGPVVYPPGVVYPAPFGFPITRIFPGELKFPMPPSPWAGALSWITGILGQYGPRYQYTLARVGSWRGAIDYDDPVPAPLTGGFASTGAAAAPVGPVTLPSTIYLDIGPPL